MRPYQLMQLSYILKNRIVLSGLPIGRNRRYDCMGARGKAPTVGVSPKASIVDTQPLRPENDFVQPD